MKFGEYVSLTEAKLTPEMDELQLYIDNDYQLYRSQFIPILKNYTRKMRKGVYDRKLAAKGFMHLLDRGARQYVKEFGSPGDKVQTMFPKKDREKLAMQYAMQFEIDYKNQEYDFMQESKSHLLSESNRPIYEIALDIRKDWKKVNYAAKPYLDAMNQLDKITDMYMFDSAKSVVAYFLSNASSWRGPVAKTIKAELKSMLKR